MELQVQPSDLQAAAASLTACAAHLEAANAAFGRAAHLEIPDLGASAAEAAGRAADAAGQAVGVITTDVDQLSAALRSLAAFYPQVDTSAVPGP